MKVVIELKIDQDAYDRKYGPGSEWWLKYGTAPGDYELRPNNIKPHLTDMITDILKEGFYDWRGEDGEGVGVSVTFP